MMALGQLDWQLAALHSSTSVLVIKVQVASSFLTLEVTPYPSVPLCWFHASHRSTQIEAEEVDFSSQRGNGKV